MLWPAAINSQAVNALLTCPSSYLLQNFTQSCNILLPIIVRLPTLPFLSDQDDGVGCGMAAVACVRGSHSMTDNY